MMWGLFALMALAVVAALLWPLLRKQAAAADRSDYDLVVFRDQLAEVDRDVERGVLTADQAEAARLEIKRRMLAAGKRAGTSPGRDAPRANAFVTAFVAVVVPFVALGLYLVVGMPQLPVGEQTVQTPEEREMAALIDQLAARMRAQPDDAQGWALLARSLRQMDRYADAAEAYRNVMRLAPQNADGFAGFGEAATAAAAGSVSAEARDAMLRALQLDRSEPRSQFYLGRERAQAGDNRSAMAIWRALTAGAPPDAPWLAAVRGQMSELAQSANIMPMNVEPRHALDVFGALALAAAPSTPFAPGTDPAAPNVGALKDRFSPENLEMIQGMIAGLVAKLENDPDNYDGWMMLGRSYTVLRTLDGAKVAYAQAMKLKPAEAEPKAQLTQLLLQDPGVPPPLVQVATAINAGAKREPLALFILGTERATAGDAAAARKLWQDAATALPQDAPLRGEIARRLKALK